MKRPGSGWTRCGPSSESRWMVRRRSYFHHERACRVSDPTALPPYRPTAEGQTFTGESLLVRYVNFVKLPHTLFALPFALLGVLAASMTEPVTPKVVLLAVIAFSAARWAAMGFNRIAD